MTDHPITPPPELVQQWASKFYGTIIAPGEVRIAIATQAARWGANIELDACCEHLKRIWSPSDTIDSLRTARRPKPPSLKAQALSEVAAAVAGGNITPERGAKIRLALEQLND